ncbi:unnamed protein product [Auanema sp. JU1783]|nr:unnamed protein product [Auanema sp. JU1783]
MTVVDSPETNIFLEYVIGLPEDDINFLQKEPSSAFFLFRLLPDVAQQLLVKLIWNSNVVDALKHDNKEIGSNLDLLKKLKLVRVVEGSCTVNDNFRRAYLYAVMNGSKRCAQIDSTEVEEQKRNKDIVRKSNERWECILRYLALPSEQNKASVSLTTRKLFNSANFTSGEGEGDMEITSAGFQFLLLSPIQQLWTYMSEYLKLAQSEGKDLKELMIVLIKIILCVDKGDDITKRAYELDNSWSKEQNELVMHMRELGLIFLRTRKNGIFFLTPLLWHLSSRSDDDQASQERKDGYIIVETNFRLYAYTNSSLDLAILSTFTEMTYRFNDMSVGILTRESVRRALQVGITANQIISFLRSNAHSKCLNSSGPLNCLPITVADQIRLWEDERKRLVFTDATIYSVFDSEEEFVGVRDFAANQDVLLWADSTQKLVIVTDEGHSLVKQWWRQHRGQ